MTSSEPAEIISAYHAFLNDNLFPCVGAKAALTKRNIQCMVAAHMACPAEDPNILEFLYRFVDVYRRAAGIFHSAAILFCAPADTDEKTFERLMWIKLQALSDLDAINYDYDKRVSSDSSEANFSFSLKAEAFYIIGLHPASSRKARRFAYPAIVFNPHAQFEKLRTTNSYEKIKAIVRKRDIACSGSVNPMLDDFGKSSEAVQYSGRMHDDQWQCPLTIKHGKIKHHPAP